MSNQYVLQLTGARGTVRECDYHLDDAFFEAAGDSVVSGGNVQAHADIERHDDGATIRIAFAGTLRVACDRCLAPMDVEVEAEEALKVVYGDHYEDDGETVTIDERDGRIDLAGILFELAALQVPMQHVHPEGECDPQMADMLKGLMVTEGRE